MKLKALAKATLVLGLLATGVITTESQTVKAAESTQGQHNYKSLKYYYSKPSIELINVDGLYRQHLTDKGAYVWKNLKDYYIGLLGEDSKKFKSDVYGDLDAFLVIEEEPVKGRQYSIGGISKTNSKEFKEREVDVKVTRKADRDTTSTKDSKFKITKEEISLKELDFKLRQKLMKEENLYDAINHRKGKIVVKMEDDKFYTFEPTKKLQPHRMGDTIDGTKIKEINVELEYK
ncbi:superantigen-like protein SSL6 [Staphylococcus aureus]|uniref:superantigen-like protein SSL6 n=1 Tax=Staphylococcus aureus TaxID=1280 RepID=UPI00404B463E